MLDEPEDVDEAAAVERRIPPINGNAGAAADPRGADPTELLPLSLSGVLRFPDCDDALPNVSELMVGSDMAALRRGGKEDARSNRDQYG